MLLVDISPPLPHLDFLFLTMHSCPSHPHSYPPPINNHYHLFASLFLLTHPISPLSTPLSTPSQRPYHSLSTPLYRYFWPTGQPISTTSHFPNPQRRIYPGRQSFNLRGLRQVDYVRSFDSPYHQNAHGIVVR